MRAEPLLIPAFNPGPYTGSGNNTYLFQGREPTLVDAGIGNARHLEVLERTLGGRPLSRVLVTHAHSDHAAGAEAIAARWPSAAFAKMPWPGRDDRYAVPWQPVSEGDRVLAGDAFLRIVHTPGHAPDHLCFFDEGTRMLLCGDLIVSGTTVVIPASGGGDLAQYLNSLKKVLALAPARLLPAHGPPIGDPPVVIRQYLDHRQAREHQIVSALRSGHHTIEAIMASVYEDLSPDLMGAARETVLAHLLKLQAEGRVTRRDTLWETG